VYCPANHCLKRIADGSSHWSFSCEQYADAGYQCAFEGDPRECACDGFVKLGNYIQNGHNATWSDEMDVNTSIACTTTAFGGDPISGAKVCWCRPRSPVANSRSTQPASDTQELNLMAPSCIITDMELAAAGQTAEGLYGLGVNQGVANTLIKESIEGYFTTTHPKWLAFDTSTLMTTVQIDCSSSQKCFGSAVQALSKIFEERSAASSALTTTAQDFVAANSAAFGDLAMIGPAMVVTVKPDSFPTETSTTTTTTTTTTAMSGAVDSTTVTTTMGATGGDCSGGAPNMADESALATAIPTYLGCISTSSCEDSPASWLQELSTVPMVTCAGILAAPGVTCALGLPMAFGALLSEMNKTLPDAVTSALGSFTIRNVCCAKCATMASTGGQATEYTSSMTLQLADAAAFVASEHAKTIMEHSIAESNADITASMVNVTSIALSSTRRLSENHTAGGVDVEYKVMYPAGHSNPVLTVDAINTETLKTAIAAKATSLGLTVTVTSVTKNAVTCDPCGQAPGTTTAMMSDTTAMPTSGTSGGDTTVSGAPGTTTTTRLLALMCAVVIATFAV